MRQLSFFPIPGGVIKNCGKCHKDYRDCSTYGRAHYCPSCRVPTQKERNYESRKPKFGQKLSTRESQIAGMLVEGKLNKEIAWVCKLSLGTVKVYTGNMYVKTGTNSRVKFVMWWLRKNNKLVA